MSGMVQRRGSIGLVALWMLIAACVTWAARAPGVAMPGADYDTGIYLDLARSLASGRGYHHLLLPGAPAGVHYPPLYPAVLALWLRAFVSHDAALGVTIAWAAALNRVLIVLAVGLWVGWSVREGLGRWGAAMMAALAFTPYALEYSTALYAEPLCWCLLGGAALATSGAVDERERHVRPWRSAVALLLLALLPLARSALIPFALAGAWWAWRGSARPWRRRAAAVAVLVPAALWGVWSAAHASAISPAWRLVYGPYLDVIRAAHFGARDWLVLAWRQFLAALVGLGLAVPPIAWGGVIAGCVFGAPLARVRSLRPLAAGALLSAGLLAAWPAVQPRFLAALVPVVLALGAAGMPGFLDRERSGAALALGRAPWIALGALTVVWLWLAARGTASGARHMRALVASDDAVVAWIRAHPDTLAVVAEREPEVALGAGRAVYPAGELDPRSAVDRTPYLRFDLRSSLCTAGSGWLLVSDAGQALDAAWRRLAADAAAPVAFGASEPLGARGAAVPFRCRR